MEFLEKVDIVIQVPASEKSTHQNRLLYPAELREHIVASHRIGRSMASLTCEFEPPLLSWTRAASSSSSPSTGELEWTEREELLLYLRQEVATLKFSIHTEQMY